MEPAVAKNDTQPNNQPTLSDRLSIGFDFKKERWNFLNREQG